MEKKTTPTKEMELKAVNGRTYMENAICQMIGIMVTSNTIKAVRELPPRIDIDDAYQYLKRKTSMLVLEEFKKVFLPVNEYPNMESPVRVKTWTWFDKIGDIQVEYIPFLNPERNPESPMYFRLCAVEYGGRMETLMRIPIPAEMCDIAETALLEMEDRFRKADDSDDISIQKISELIMVIASFFLQLNLIETTCGYLDRNIKDSIIDMYSDTVQCVTGEEIPDSEKEKYTVQFVEDETAQYGNQKKRTGFLLIYSDGKMTYPVYRREFTPEESSLFNTAYMNGMEQIDNTRTEMISRTHNGDIQN